MTEQNKVDRGCKRAPELDACVNGNANMWRIKRADTKRARDETPEKGL